jgi:hypothetical protein
VWGVWQLPVHERAPDRATYRRFWESERGLVEKYF